ncbi:hypothetical protein [Rufibacter latericius]|uniref:hypothetical protein n=1 Tax=Rufibacter latericius TaxID=2487040 RepID=UPI0014036C46|nr:hypothetical protein [Rufibacter latericius]
MTEKEGRKAGSLIQVRERLVKLYQDGVINEDELESLEAPFNKILEDMGVRKYSKEF